MDSKKLSAKDVKAIASLPSKEVLLGQIVGLLVSPHRGLLGVLNGVPRNLVQVINAIKEKKQ
jgi:large subunit ribosomal protein L10